MNNVLLDPLPEVWENRRGETFRLDTDFRIGIQIYLLREDPDITEIEKFTLASNLLFVDEKPDDVKEIEECIKYFLGGWSHDKPGKERNTKLMDFDIDQWRIFSAFYSQYHIDLSIASMHWWQFMGMLSALGECSYTQVIDIRNRKVKPKMDKEAKQALQEAKRIYNLDTPLTHDEMMLMEEMDDLLGLSADEKARRERFEQYAEVD